MKLFRNGFWLNLLPIFVHYHPSKTDVLVLAFIVSVLSFVLAYFIVWLLVLPFSLFSKKYLQKEKSRVYAFYFSILLVFVNNIIGLVMYLMDKLYKITDKMPDNLIGLMMVALSTTPFFAILLLVWLVIFLARRKLNKSGGGGNGEHI